MKFNVACRSGTIDQIFSVINLKSLRGPIKKTLYESDVGKEFVEITLVPIGIPDDDFNFVKYMFPILKAIPGVIFIEPIRDGVIAYEYDT